MIHSLFYEAALVIAVLFLGATTDISGELLPQNLGQISNAISYEQTTQISFELEYFGGDEFFQDEMRPLSILANATTFTLHTAYNYNAANNLHNLHVRGIMDMDPLQLYGELWLAVDESGEYPNIEMLVRIPAMFRAFLPVEYSKDYLFVEFDRLIELAEEQGNFIDIYEALNLANFFNSPHTQQNLIDIAMRINLPEHLINNVSLQVTEASGGVTQLEISISDQQLKNLILALLKELRANEEAQSAVADLIYVIANRSAWWYVSIDEIREELEEALSYYVLPYVEAHFAEYALLNDRGFTYLARFTPEGYLIHNTAVIGFYLHSNPFSWRFSPPYPPELISLTITISSDYRNINRPVSAAFPHFNQNNSANLVDNLRKSIEARRVADMFRFPWSRWMYDELMEVGEEPVIFPLTGTVNSEEINTSMALIFYDNPWQGWGSGDFHMSLLQVSEIFGGDLKWEGADGHYIGTWLVNDMEIPIIGVPSDLDADLEEILTALIDDEDDRAIARLNLAAGMFDWVVVIDHEPFMLVRSIQDILNVDFGFNNETGSLLVR